MNLETTKRCIKVFDSSGKHVKSFTLYYTNHVERIMQQVGDKLNYKRKRLTDDEYVIVGSVIFLDITEKYIQRLDKHLQERLSGAEIVGCRFVNSKNGNRHELCFDNNLKVKCDVELFKLSPVKLPVAFLNY